MMRQILTYLLCLTPMSTTFLVSPEAVFANPSNDSLPIKLAHLPGPTLKTTTVTGGKVMPSTAKIAGYSLVDMAQALAYFTTSGNNLTYLPKTPFSILYLKNLADRTNSFTVSPGTHLFVPISSMDDSPPVAGNFPSTPDQVQVQNYVFSQEQLGAQFEITVDGKTTSIRPSYVAGPVYAPKLLDGDGSHFMQVGVFLTPLSPGEHTITCRAFYGGNAITALTGGAPVSYEFTYTVTVK